MSERAARGGAVRQVCRRALREVLYLPIWTAVADPRHLHPVADRLFRGYRQRAWDRLAFGGFVGAAALCRDCADGGYTGPLDHIADEAADRCRDASGSLRLGVEAAGGSWAATGPADWH